MASKKDTKEKVVKGKTTEASKVSKAEKVKESVPKEKKSARPVATAIEERTDEKFGNRDLPQGGPIPKKLGDPNKAVKVLITYEDGHTKETSSFFMLTTKTLEEPTRFSTGKKAIIITNHLAPSDTKENVAMGLALISKGHDIVAGLVGLPRIG